MKNRSLDLFCFFPRICPGTKASPVSAENSGILLIVSLFTDCALLRSYPQLLQKLELSSLTLPHFGQVIIFSPPPGYFGTFVCRLLRYIQTESTYRRIVITTHKVTGQIYHIAQIYVSYYPVVFCHFTHMNGIS